MIEDVVEAEIVGIDLEAGTVVDLEAEIVKIDLVLLARTVQSVHDLALVIKIKYIPSFGATFFCWSLSTLSLSYGPCLFFTMVAGLTYSSASIVTTYFPLGCS